MVSQNTSKEVCNVMCEQMLKCIGVSKVVSVERVEHRLLAIMINDVLTSRTIL